METQRSQRLLAYGALIVVLIWALIVGLLTLPSGADDQMSRGTEAITSISWTQTAQTYRGQTDDVVFYCPKNGQLGEVSGSDVYADNSSICSAAVHGGLITVADGGAIAIRLLAGESKYMATTQNNVTSHPLGPWFGSFTFTTLHDPIAGMVTVDGQSVPIQVATWQTTAVQFLGREGEAIALYCPPNGEIGVLWGADVYRDASSICSAAVHDSRLTVVDGGAIAIVMSTGRSSYLGSIQNGVTSQAFGQAASSFEFTSFQ